MHDNSMILMKEFVEKYDLAGATVVDIGSYDCNGTYRPLFPGGKYIGVDVQAGPNVDVIMGSDGWNSLEDVDAAICGQTLEHVADIPALMAEIFRVLKPGGLLCMIAPSAGPPHNYPIWVGHFSAERMTKIVTAAGLKVVDCTISPAEPFRDTCCVARKPEAAEKERGVDEDQ